jgi:predicted DCC family thiol-disulfide oxidoreductase YuxK
MNNSWTVGQFRVFRIVLGLYLLQHFVALLPWGAELFSSAGVLPTVALSPLGHLFPSVFLLSDSPATIWVCLVAGVALSAMLALGKFDRVCAFLLWYLWACLYARNPLIGNPSLPFIGWLLLAYLLIPASRRNDDATDWRMPQDVFRAAWILMSLAYLYSGYTKLASLSWVDGSALSRVLANPLARDTALRTALLTLPPVLLKLATWSALALELGFAPLALFGRLRPYLWLAMVSMHVGLLSLVNFSDLTWGMLVLHLFTFDPGWIRAPQPAGEFVFYDGECALCHGFVRFVLEEDRSATPFAFAPLGGERFRESIDAEARERFPESLVVVDARGTPLTKSSAVAYVLKHLGGLWFVAGCGLVCVPKVVRDFAYDCVAFTRRKLFGTTSGACPLVPPVWRGRLHS